VPEAAGDVFQLVEDLTTSTQPGITADNYEAAIALLNEFATAAQVGAREEQLHDQATKRGKGFKTKKPESNEIVVRGSKAMTIVFQLSSRVTHFIEQSHLETNEGRFSNVLFEGMHINNKQHGQPTGPRSSKPSRINVSIPAAKFANKPSALCNARSSPTLLPPQNTPNGLPFSAKFLSHSSHNSSSQKSTRVIRWA